MATTKFWRLKRDLSTIEQNVGVAITQIESMPDFKAELKNFYLSTVTDLTTKINAKKPVYLVLIPFPCLKIFQKISAKLISELEKRVKATILIAAKRTIESRWIKTHRSQQRPFSRTLTSVYEALLDDLLTPATIIGKRTRVRVDGSRFHRIFLDVNEKEIIESRLDSIKAAYKVLTTRELEFEFKVDEKFYQSKKTKKTNKK